MFLHYETPECHQQSNQYNQYISNELISDHLWLSLTILFPSNEGISHSPVSPSCLRHSGLKVLLRALRSCRWPVPAWRSSAGAEVKISWAPVASATTRATWPHFFEHKALTLNVSDCGFGDAGVEDLKPLGNVGDTRLGCYFISNCWLSQSFGCVSLQVSFLWVSGRNQRLVEALEHSRHSIGLIVEAFECPKAAWLDGKIGP